MPLHLPVQIREASHGLHLIREGFVSSSVAYVHACFAKRTLEVCPALST